MRCYSALPGRVKRTGVLELPRHGSRRMLIPARIGVVVARPVLAHLYPGHEQRLGVILRAELPGVPVSLSSEVLREQQEYERTATTVGKAYVRPLVEDYLSAIGSAVGAPCRSVPPWGGASNAPRRTSPSL